MRIKASWLAPLVAASLISLSGCSTTADFSHTPTDSSEFAKDISELKNNYSDIEKYDKRTGSRMSMPPATDLEKRWGKPETKKGWGGFVVSNVLLAGIISAVGISPLPFMALGAIMAPPPAEDYVWEKGNYEIIAHGYSDVLTGYEKRIYKWEWREKTSPSREVAPNPAQGQKTASQAGVAP